MVDSIESYWLKSRYWNGDILDKYEAILGFTKIMT